MSGQVRADLRTRAILELGFGDRQVTRVDDDLRGGVTTSKRNVALAADPVLSLLGRAEIR